MESLRCLRSNPTWGIILLMIFFFSFLDILYNLQNISSFRGNSITSLFFWMFVDFFKKPVLWVVSRFAQKFHTMCTKNLELHLSFIESILKVGGSCKALVRFTRSSNKVNSFRSTRLKPSDIAFQRFDLTFNMISLE